MLSTRIAPEILEYPDRDIVTVNAKGEELFQGRHGEPAEYWDGES
jgi:uncharacterized cupin superfamily protein